MSDFSKCSWPAPLSTSDDSIAQRLDEMNEASGATIEELRAAHPSAPLITFSHFVPRPVRPAGPKLTLRQPPLTGDLAPQNHIRGLRR